ncbi:SDR family oxidoreductase [Sulfidibacter corallicola]|uniref:3-dehydrosphinganine reductase n=1 Tax=Sulfidibacter corallicola TaxID=2818388 RepID=A0A8A4TLP7_SULCO|nr:SDR family oxidoreductase [Sulfidibacter corallicola]QTD50134.1 SDR family oxidoreductase [Sulfidibacter corallicola]
MAKTSFAGRAVYITGGFSGIGLALARLLARQGARLALFARRKERLQEAVAALRDSGDASERLEVFFEALDVSDEAAVGRVMAEAVSRFGSPDVLVNNAGIAHTHYFEDIDSGLFERMLQVNLCGPRHVTTALLPHMGRGSHVVNVSSLAGLIGIFGYTGYSASKFGLIGFSEALRCELAPRGVRVSVVCPVDTDTPQLHEENLTKPPETAAISGKGVPLTAEKVARDLLKGVRRGSFMIIPGWEGKFYWWANRFLPGLVRMIIDREVRRVASS